ncbi:hypothetical protein E4U41_002411 [Claviceps citrina]|nr:hypothetical protein E4U41_002411 [Claviceps citrina]
MDDDAEPAIRYPPRIVIFDAHSETDYSPHISDDSTIAESECEEEEAPQLCRDGADAQDAKARRAVKKKLCIRLTTSIFITVIVSLLVAAVVARICDRQAHPMESSNQTVTSTDSHTNRTALTVYSPSSKSTSSLLPVGAATANTVHTSTTAVPEGIAEPTATASCEPGASMTSVRHVWTVDCASTGAFAGASLITDTAPEATGGPGSIRRRRTRQPSAGREDRDDQTQDDQLIAMSVYAFGGGCLLTRSAYKDAGSGNVVFQCIIMCLGKKLETNQARNVVTDEWGACG